MPISLGELQNNTRSLVVDYDGEKVQVVYRPGVITPGSGTEFAAQGVVEQLERLLVSWDITDDKGKALPVSTELLNQLPGRFLAHVADAVSGDMRPNGKRAAS